MYNYNTYVTNNSNECSLSQECNKKSVKNYFYLIFKLSAYMSKLLFDLIKENRNVGLLVTAQLLNAYVEIRK